MSKRPPHDRRVRDDAAKKQTSKSDLARQRILDAAALALSENGYASTRLSDIAKLAGTQAGSLYYHFPSREDLVQEVLKIGTTRVHDAVKAKVDALPSSASARDRLAAAIAAALAMLLQMDRYSAANLRVVNQLPEHIREKHVKLHKAYGELWRSLIADAARNGQLRSNVDTSIIHLLILGSVNWSIEWYRPGRLSIEEIAEQLVTMVFDGIDAKAAQ